MLPDGYPPIAAYEELDASPEFGELKAYAGSFIQSNPDALAYYTQRWVANPIHNWSRRWEYLYVFEKLSAFVRQSGQEKIAALDAGSGLTFFPHYAAQKNPPLHIECGDADPQLIEDSNKLINAVPERVSYTIQDIENLSYADDSFDAVYCISVLEHCRNLMEAAKGMHRALKPNGRLILTIDISLDGQHEIPIQMAMVLVQRLSTLFKPDENYIEMLKTFQPKGHVSTAYAQSRDATLLPWAPPRFHLLTFFCMCFTRIE